ncbi:MAG TPA: glycoside hydrolase family 20 protein [Bacteroidia bacterium]|nr:glycoside hydrolase family 20 protein [Bacteroidia bacterium]HNU32035.1 glycoside hydrolase family 20 protein [Bacteroidia bacterium]
MKKLFLFALSLMSVCAQSQNCPVIPLPNSYIQKSGTFTINKKTNIVEGPIWQTGDAAARIYSTYFQNFLGLPLTMVAAYRDGVFENGINLKKVKDAALGDEGYNLVVKPEAIIIKANTDTGFYYALQTLIQLMPVEDFYKPNNKSISIQCCEITDVPRFKYRGMHLDVSRHFFPVSFIKNYIELMAMHKMNTFHWHLTDDQGWRIEIKKYPKLTEVGSKRKESMIGAYDDNKFDGTPYSGFYTQEEIKDVVAFAALRNVTVIPEIEMPGHALAALASYPQYSCTGGPFEVATKWGVFDDVFCPTEETFNFLQDVLSEVVTLFPSQYIHIGGDECPKTRWRICPKCQQRIKDEGLKDEFELQSYFIKRIEKFLLSKGKKIIGWDEILEGGASPTATIMSWRGMDGGIKAARSGNNVIMTPGSHCYFDHYQSESGNEPIGFGGNTTLFKVYSFEPVPPDSLNPQQQKLIVGAQGNVWSEYITTTTNAEFRAYPRAVALAEVLWSRKDQRNWTGFSSRLLNHFKRLDKLKLNYAKHIFDVTATTAIDTVNNKVTIAYNKFVADGEIHFTNDGSEPSLKSELYKSPVAINSTSSFKAALFRNGEKGNTLTKKYTIHHATGLPYSLTNNWKQYDGGTTYGLTDGIIGEFKKYNTWVGFSGKDLEAVIDLKKAQAIKKISINFYDFNAAWIFLPQYVEILGSSDGVNFTPLKKENINKGSEVNSIVNFSAALNADLRFLKVFAKSIGKCPNGTQCDGQDAWLFVDEVVVE